MTEHTAEKDVAHWSAPWLLGYCCCPEIEADDLDGPEPHTCSSCGFPVMPAGGGV